MFELFARIDCVGDDEPVISMMYPPSIEDQVCRPLLVHLTCIDPCFLTVDSASV